MTEATDHSVQLQLVAAGIGVALVRWLADGVCLLPLHTPVERHHFALTRRSASGDAGIRRIVEVLKDGATRVAGGAPRRRSRD